MISVFANLVIDSENGNRGLTTVKETPHKQLRDYQTYAPKKFDEAVHRSLKYDKVNELKTLWLKLESEDSRQKSHPINQEKEEQPKIDCPVVIDLTGGSDDEVEMAPNSNENSMDSDKENREPQFSGEEGNSPPPPQEHYHSSEKMETPLALLNAPKKRVFKRNSRKQINNNESDVDDEAETENYSVPRKLRRVLIFDSDSD